MKPVLGLVATMCGALFLGYCIYFDKKRRSHPNFRKNLRLRRKAEGGSKSSVFSNNAEQTVQQAFLHEIHAGQELLMNGDFEQGIDHLARGVLISSAPIQLLQVFKQSLPYNLFTSLMQRVQVLQMDGIIQPATSSVEDFTDRSSLD